MSPELLTNLAKEATGDEKVAYPEAAQQMSCRSCVVVLHLFLHRRSEETAEPIVDLLDGGGVSVAGIAALTAESPGNGAATA
jgi:hypothetical protein